MGNGTSKFLGVDRGQIIKVRFNNLQKARRWELRIKCAQWAFYGDASADSTYARDEEINKRKRRVALKKV